MKRLHLFMALMLIMGVAIKAQEKANNRLFVIHEDRVHPSKVQLYEETSKALNAVLKKHNLQGADYLALATDDFRYSFVSEIENFAELDENPMSGLSELEGKENMQKLWSNFDQCYDSHVNYIMILDEGLSYMPEGVVINDPDQLYRDFQYWYIAPANMESMRKLAEEYKALCIEKGSQVHYRVYRSGFGTDDNYMMFVASGKDAAEFEARRKASNELIGEAGKNLYFRALEYALRIEMITGWIRPDLSFTAEESMVKE